MANNATGATNLSQVSGQSLDELLAGWSLAMAVDDLDGFTPASAAYEIPSWNTRDVFAGPYADFPSTFTRADPLAVTAVSSGSFTATVSALRGGSPAFFRVSAAAGGTLLKLLSTDGGTAQAELGMVIVRLSS